MMARSTTHLHERYPGFEGVPFVSLGDLPTPVTELGSLARELGVAGLWVKRDDRAARLYGGNKIRKLEFILGEILAREGRSLLTIGAMGSHHLLATALFARRQGIAPHLVLFPQPVTNHARKNLAVTVSHAARVTWAPSFLWVPLATAGAWVRARRLHRAAPAWVPPGGTGVPGTFGYVDAAFELKAQIEAGELPEPDVIHLPAGTLGTMVGLAVGCVLAGLKSRVRGIRVVEKAVTNRFLLRRLVRETCRALGARGIEVPPVEPDRAELVDGFCGAGYGRTTVRGREAMALVDFHAPALILDPTYTAKAWAGALPCMCEEPEAVHLIWNTLSATRPEPATRCPGHLPRPVRALLK